MDERALRRPGGAGLLQRRGTRLGLAVSLAALLLAGCEVRGGKIPYDPAGFGPPDRTTAAVGAYDVPIGPLDVLKISVFRVPDLSGEYQVDARGMIDLPLLGNVAVRDLNSDTLARELERQYGAKYLQNPEITVRIQTTNQLNVTIEGGVNAPGVYSLPGKTTLTGAVALARGINPADSNPKRIAIFRKQDGKTVAAAFDLISIRHGDMVDPMIYPGDTIVVDASRIRSIYRDLLQTLPAIAVFNSF